MSDAPVAQGTAESPEKVKPFRWFDITVRLPDPDWESSVADFVKFKVFKVHLEDASPAEPDYYYFSQPSSIDSNITVFKITLRGTRIVLFLDLPYSEVKEREADIFKCVIKSSIFRKFVFRSRVLPVRLSGFPNLQRSLYIEFDRGGSVRRSVSNIIPFLIQKFTSQSTSEKFLEFATQIEYTVYAWHPYPWGARLRWCGDTIFDIIQNAVNHPVIPETRFALKYHWKPEIILEISFAPNLSFWRYDRYIPKAFVERYVKEVFVPERAYEIIEKLHSDGMSMVYISVIAKELRDPGALRVSSDVAWEYLNTLYHLRGFVD